MSLQIIYFHMLYILQQLIINYSILKITLLKDIPPPQQLMHP